MSFKKFSVRYEKNCSCTVTMPRPICMRIFFNYRFSTNFNSFFMLFTDQHTQLILNICRGVPRRGSSGQWTPIVLNLACGPKLTPSVYIKVWAHILKSSFLELILWRVQMSITKNISHIYLSMTRTTNILIYIFSKSNCGRYLILLK